MMRKIGLDLLKIFACIGVVMLHTTMGGFSQTESWNINAYLYYLGVYSIPLFFMINGYFLLNKKELSYTYVFRKIKLIILSVAVWTLLIWLLKRDFSENPIRKIFGSLLQRGYFFQFWFFGSLIIIYLTLPLVKKYLNSKKRYYISLLFLAIVGLCFEIGNMIFHTALQAHVVQSFRLWTWYFYYILGGLVGSIDLDKIQFYTSKLWKHIYLDSFILSPFYMFFVAKYLHNNLFAEYFYDNLLIKFVTLGLFLIFLQVRNVKWSQYVTTLSTLIMGVFIVHTYVMKVWEKVIGFDFPLAYLVYFLATLVLSFALSAIIAKIPYLNRLIRL